MIRAWRRPLRDLAVIAAGLFALSFLPPDTSLQDRRKVGTLRYCVADRQSPLITDAVTSGAGPEHLLMQRVAESLGLKLVLIETANMKRSFNPADWNVTRGQCDVLGGGLVDNAINRGFLALLPTGLETGLVLTGPSLDLPKGQEVGVFLGNSGFDRVALSGWMRQQGWRARPLRDENALQLWLRTGKPLVTSGLGILSSDTIHQPLPDELSQGAELAIGLWRGDMTLQRAIRNVFP